VIAQASLATAYSQSADAWTRGPTRVYGRLAELLVAASPVPFRGAVVLDLGAGTGVGSSAATAAGARVIALDLALGMLVADRERRPPAVVGDAVALPFAPGAFDVALAPFCLNHLDDPSAGVAEAARVLRRDGALVASTYAADDDHVVKAAVDQALSEAGWSAPGWYGELKAAMASWGTVDAAAVAIERGGMDPVLVERREVVFPDLTPLDLVAWRLGMAHTAPFVAGLDRTRRDELRQRALELLGPDPPPLVRRVIFLAAV
jgi:ubiquinone/menaquinone biosynthesis C-methylase UbiE